MDHSEAFRDIVVILTIAAASGLIAVLLRQPLIMAFIVAGLVVGPSGFGLVETTGTVELFGRMGIALLLFVVGLKLDLALVRTSGSVAMVSGIGQVAVTALLGVAVTLAMGMPMASALYISLALTFSSTVIVVKLLSDRREIDSLHGRIALGILIVQDFMVLVALVVLAGLGEAQADESLLMGLGLTALKGVGLFGAVILVARFVLPLVEERIATSSEMFVLGGIAWSVGLAVAAETLGLSLEMGAFVAGLSLAGRPARELLAARLISVRDFLLLFFFVNLGAQITLADLTATLVPALLLSAFVLVGNPLIVLAIMVAMRFRVRTGFFAGAALAQISEFSFVMMAMGVSLGHVTHEDLATVTMVGLVTFGASTYLIVYSNRIYEWFRPVLRHLERSVVHPEEDADDGSPRPEVLVFGAGRLGTGLLMRLRERGMEGMGIDFDPVAVRRVREAGFHMRFGDAEDPEFVGMLPLAAVRMAISTVPMAETGSTLYHALRSHGFEGPIILTSNNAAAAKRLGEYADLVLLPYEAAAERAAEVVQRGLDEPGYLEQVREEPRVPVEEVAEPE